MSDYPADLAGLVRPHRRTFVPKGWGWEDWIWNGDLYCGKVLFVKQAKECSYHYHKVKDETFLLLEGRVLLVYTDSGRRLPRDVLEVAEEYGKAASVILEPGDVFHVPPLMRHQFRGLRDSRLIEFSTHHDDADSHRLVKGY
jgi:mannose-6-phosphate isomerase-like protein (cupin superfamily)